MLIDSRIMVLSVHYSNILLFLFIMALATKPNYAEHSGISFGYDSKAISIETKNSLSKYWCIFLSIQNSISDDRYSLKGFIFLISVHSFCYYFLLNIGVNIHADLSAVLLGFG